MDEGKPLRQHHQITLLKNRVTELETQLKEFRQDVSAGQLTTANQMGTSQQSPFTGDLYRSLIENASDAVIVAQDEAFAFYNRRTAELTGYDYKELASIPFLNLVFPEDRKLVGSRYLQRLAGDDVVDSYTFRALKKNGTHFWVEIHAVRMDWHNRPAVLCYITDISQRKETEKDLIESEQQYRNIVELSPYGIVTVDTRGIILTINSAFTKLTGYDYEDFIGRYITQVPTLRLKDAPYFLKLFTQLIKDGFKKPVVFAWTHKDGSERWGEARGVLIRSENRITGLQGIIRDITEQRRASLLLDALNQTALSVAQSTTPQEIYDAVGAQFNQLDIGCAILLSQDNGKYLVTTYLTYKNRAIKLAERLISVKAENYTIDVSKVDVFKKVVWGKQTVFITDPLLGAQQMLSGSMKAVAPQLLRTLNIKTSINAPLIIDDKVIGMLTVQSDVLRDADVPAITAFANIVAAALHKAQLLEKAQIELAERRRAEGEILRLQRLLQNITDSMPSALITLDVNGYILTANPAANTILKRHVLLEPGKVLWKIDSAFELYKELFDEVVQTRNLVHRHQQEIVIHESVVYQDIDAFPLIVDTFEGIVFRIDDVTEFVKLQDVMLQSAKLASVGGLAAGVAHEINNPLAAMIQSAQMIHQILDSSNSRTVKRMEEVGVDPSALEQYTSGRHLFDYVEGIREAGGRAAKIVTDLLTFSRKSSSEMLPVDIQNVIEIALGLAAKNYNLKNHYDFRDIDIVRNLDHNLPLVICDQQQIQQVLLNLLQNAAQSLAGEYEKHPSYQPRIIIGTEYDGNIARISIQDNGMGIEESVMEHLFEPFYTTKDVGKGTGLGLWLCWSIIVERHQGRIWAEPANDKGVRFVIELPIGEMD